jgi:hypothetical protein
MAGLWFSPGPPVSSTNKSERHNITEILLKVALNTIKQTNKSIEKPTHNRNKLKKNKEMSHCWNSSKI